MVFFITFKLLKTLTNNIKYSRQAVPFFFQAEDGIRDCLLSRGLGDVYKRQDHAFHLLLLEFVLIALLGLVIFVRYL